MPKPVRFRSNTRKDRQAAALYRLVNFDDPGEEKFSPGLVRAIQNYLEFGTVREVAKILDCTDKRIRDELRCHTNN